MKLNLTLIANLYYFDRWVINFHLTAICNITKMMICSIINQKERVIYYVLVSVHAVGNTLYIDTIAELPVIAANQGYCDTSRAAVDYIQY